MVIINLGFGIKAFERQGSGENRISSWEEDDLWINS